MTTHISQGPTVTADADRRIMIDGFNLALPRGTGVSTYGYSLANTLKGMGWQVDGLYGLRMGKTRKLRETIFFESMGGDHVTKAPLPGSFAWTKEVAQVAWAPRGKLVERTGKVITDAFSYRLPEFDRILAVPDVFDRGARHFKRFGQFLTVRVPNPPKIMHWTYPVPVRLAGVRNIYTLHDLVPLRLPYASLDNKRFYFKLIREIVKTADHIVTVSEASKTDIETLYKIKPDRITNTYQAVRVSPQIRATSDAEIADTVRGVFNLPYQGYFLFFGAVEPKKNVGRLIEAYLSLATETQLVIVGTKAWQADEELRLLQRDETAPLRASFRRVRRLGYLPRSLLMRLARGARAVAFPSLYEGFGLPVLEAMQLGVPVMTSRVSSLPEVAGDAALYVDPYDVGDIAAGLRKLDTDAELRARLSAAGPVQAERYSVEAYQARLTDMYDGILARRRRIFL
jgi:glycosyltransferase involved in cell wall biosynthesis